MSSGIKPVLGIFVLAGGVYVLYKTQAGRKAWDYLKEKSPQVTQTLDDGTTAALSTLKGAFSKVAESFSEGYAEVVDNVTSKMSGAVPVVNDKT